MERHASAFRLATEGQSLNRTSSVGAVIGCYIILMESLKQVKNIFQKEGGNPSFALTANQRSHLRGAYQRACALSSPKNYLFLINEGERKVDCFLGITAGVSWLYRSYMVLRGRVTGVSNIVPVPEDEFYTPGTDVYFCRQLFNSVRKALLQVFPLDIIENELSKEKKGSFYYSFLEDLRDICLVADTETSDFLGHHPSYPYKNRSLLMNFCN